MERKLNFIKCLLLGLFVGMLVLGGGCGGFIKVGTAKDATPPVIRFTTRPEFGVVPVAVKFDASATSDSESLISSYSWDFDGDGKEDSTAQTATFTYQQTGVYYPRLKVVNSEGLVSYSTGSEIVANDKVYIRIETDKEIYKIGEDVKITNVILVNTNSEDFIYKVGCSWPTHQVLIYDVSGNAVWKYDDSTATDSCPYGYALPNRHLKIPSKSEQNFCTVNYTCPRPWHQNYGYENQNQRYDQTKVLPIGGDTNPFREYTGEINKLRSQQQVSIGLYSLKANLIGLYLPYNIWGVKTIQIIEETQW